MTLRSVSLTALCALLFTAGLHAGFLSKRRAAEPDALAALPMTEIEADFVELPAEIRAQLDDAPAPSPGFLPAPQSFPGDPLTRSTDEAPAPLATADAILLPESETAFDPLPDECEPDLHPPMRAIHRSVTRLTPPSLAAAPRLHPSASAESPGPKLVGPMMPPPPPVDSSAIEASSGETRPADRGVDETRVAERPRFTRPSTAGAAGRSAKSVEAAGGQDRVNHRNAERAAALRRILEEELHDASPEERKVWEEEFQGLDPNIARDLLKLRRRVNSDDELEAEAAARPERFPSPQNPRRLPDTEPNLPPHPERFETAPPESSRDEGEVLRSVVATIQTARAVHLANLANAQSPGYRRRVVGFTASPAPDFSRANRPLASHPQRPLDVVLTDRSAITPIHDAEHGSRGDFGGIALAPQRLDATTQGKLLVTGEPLDIAIDGPGFLEVRSGDQRRFTRCGRLTLDDRHRLGVRSVDSVLLLHPEVSLPENAAAVRIGTSGLVEVQAGDSTEWTTAAKLMLVRFLNPSELVPAGDVLLAARPGSGAPQHGTPGAAGYGQIRSQRLEASNVDVDVERRALRRLERLQHVLAAALSGEDFDTDADDEDDGVARAGEVDEHCGGCGTLRASHTTRPCRDACDVGPCRGE